MTKIGQHTLLSRANPKTSLQSRPHIIHIYHVGIPCVLFTQDVMRCAPNYLHANLKRQPMKLSTNGKMKDYREPWPNNFRVTDALCVLKWLPPRLSPWTIALKLYNDCHGETPHIIHVFHDKIYLFYLQ